MECLKKLNLKYYEIEVNDENKETKCIHKVICEQFLTQVKKILKFHDVIIYEHINNIIFN
jgi:hypothetical protein